MSEAMRHNTGKPQMSYLLDFPNATEHFCRVCEFGAKKYARDNWKKGRKYRDTIDSLLRHLAAFQNGQDTDPESGQHHMAHVMWNAAALLEFAKLHPEMDDRCVADIPIRMAPESRYSAVKPSCVECRNEFGGPECVACEDYSNFSKKD